MGCAQSSDAAADAPQNQAKAVPVAHEPPHSLGNAQSVEKNAAQGRKQGNTRDNKQDTKYRLLEEDLAELTAEGLVHENYTFDQGGTLGAC